MKSVANTIIEEGSEECSLYNNREGGSEDCS